PAGLVAAEAQQNEPDQKSDAQHRGLLRELNAPTPQPRRMRDASGLGIRSAGDLEPGPLDLDDQIAGEAGLDAQRAFDPLPGLGDDILVEPLARHVIK